MCDYGLCVNLGKKLDFKSFVNSFINIVSVDHIPCAISHYQQQESTQAT